jgi:hypothetical protein
LDYLDEPLFKIIVSSMENLLLENDDGTYLVLTGAIIKMAITLSVNLWRQQRVPANDVLRMLIPLAKTIKQAITELLPERPQSRSRSHRGPLANSTMIHDPDEAPMNSTRQSRRWTIAPDHDYDQKYSVSKAVYRNNPDGTTVNVTKTLSGPEVAVLRNKAGEYSFPDQTHTFPISPRRKYRSRTFN